MAKTLRGQLSGVLRALDDPYERLSAGVIAQAILDRDWPWLYSQDTRLWTAYLGLDPEAFTDSLSRWQGVWQGNLRRA